MAVNQVNTKWLNKLDGLEVKTATFLNKSFPVHFHECWSLAFIKSGSEYMSFSEEEILLTQGATVLIPPYSMHKNWGTRNSIWTYKAIYIGSDFVKVLCKSLKLDYFELVSCPYFMGQVNSCFEVNEQSIIGLVGHLLTGSTGSDSTIQCNKASSLSLLHILEYVTVNFEKKVTLDSLSKEFNIDKFKLLRTFKSKVGLSPLEYQMSIRIEKSKRLFFEDMPLTHIALESGFFDQSHFTHAFKKYVGVTPGAFRSNCNIVQDHEDFLA